MREFQRLLCASAREFRNLDPTLPESAGSDGCDLGTLASAGRRIDEHCDFAFGHRSRTYLIGLDASASVSGFLVRAPKGHSGLVSSSAHWLNSDSVDRFARRLSFKKQKISEAPTRIRIGVASIIRLMGSAVGVATAANTKTAKMIPRHQPSSVLPLRIP